MERVNLIEFYWDEVSQVSEFIYEDDQTGELNFHQQSQPLAAPVLDTEEKYVAVRDSYFAGLRLWLLSQPMYD